MITYVIHNSDTGEIEDNCAVCGIVSTSNNQELENLVLPPGHTTTKLTRNDKYKIQEIDQERGRYKHKISKVSGKPVISNRRLK